MGRVWQNLYARVDPSWVADSAVWVNVLSCGYFNCGRPITTSGVLKRDVANFALAAVTFYAFT